MRKINYLKTKNIKYQTTEGAVTEVKVLLAYAKSPACT